MPLVFPTYEDAVQHAVDDGASLIQTRLNGNYAIFTIDRSNADVRFWRQSLDERNESWVLGDRTLYPGELPDGTVSIPKSFYGRSNPVVSPAMTLAIIAGSAAVVGGIVYVATRPSSTASNSSTQAGATAPVAAASPTLTSHYAGSALAPVLTQTPLVTPTTALAAHDFATGGTSNATENTTLSPSTQSNPQVLQIAPGGTETLSLPAYATWQSLSVTSGNSTNPISVSGQGSYSFTYAGGGGSVSATWTEFGGQTQSSYLTFAN